MKYLLAMIAVAALSAPAFAQEAETPAGPRVKVVKKIVETEDCESEIVEGDEIDEEALPEEIRELVRKLREHAEKVEGEVEETEIPEGLPDEIREALEEMRERMAELRKEMDKRMEEIIEELENGTSDLENDPDAEVEEWEEVSPDGNSRVKVKIVRIRKVVKEDDTPEAPETPEAPKSTERKQ